MQNSVVDHLGEGPGNDVCALRTKWSDLRDGFRERIEHDLLGACWRNAEASGDRRSQRQSLRKAPAG